MDRASKILKFFLFADDTNLLCSGPNFINLVTSINEELIKVQNWFRVNQLFLNVQKTSFMVFSKRAPVDNIVIVLCDGMLTRVYSTTFLGVIFDCKLN